ncbi:DDE-type integrase/transposase/recombinase [Pseudorhodoferax soli]|uniref:Integrase-like protein n=1 Tax=Pseudorhodoferax soli TaxID=545864 RepID=A0A368XML2_9BURK|nr:DDE-type integrase/transposase/recombinase [Pseudorhodoferax soli]RCW69210.1 integrase-like protein [Pseudorhodoferax soli]
MRPPARNQLIVNKHGELFRVLEIDAASNWVALIETNAPKALPRMNAWLKLVAQCRDGEWFDAESKEDARPRGNPSDAAIAIRNRRKASIAALVDVNGKSNPALFVRDGRGRLVEDHARTVCISAEALLANLRLWWQRGQTDDALLPGFEKCGRRVDGMPKGPTAPNAKPRGRTPTQNVYQQPFLLFLEEEQRLVARALELLEENKTNTLEKIHRTIINESYSYTDENGVRRHLPLGQFPTKRQMTYALSKVRKVSDALKRKFGAAHYDNNHKENLDSVANYVVGVGHQYEIDSTILDLWLVSPLNRTIVIGKATLYLVVDSYSRLIVGFNLSLSKPSWVNAMEAILSIFEDKQQLCERWGAEYHKDAWPAHGLLPQTILCDRGSEFTGFASDQIIQGLRCTVSNAPALMSSKKGAVECAFKLTHVPIKDNAPGYDIPSEIGQRRNGQYHKDAAYTLHETGAEILDAIYTHNVRIHGNLEMHPSDVLDGVAASPIQVWETDYPRSAGHLTHFAYDYARTRLLPQTKATVTIRGIRHEDRYYTCETAREEEWFVRAGRKTFQVQIAHDSRLVDYIYVRTGDDSSPMEIAVLTPGSRKFIGMSSIEAKAVTDLETKRRATADNNNLQLKLDQQQRAEQRKANAIAKLMEHQAQAGSDSASRKDQDNVLRKMEDKARRTEEAMRSRAAFAGDRPSVEPEPAAGDAARPVASDDKPVSWTVVVEAPASPIPPVSADKSVDDLYDEFF